MKSIAGFVGGGCADRMDPVTREDIASAAAKLGVAGQVICLHASLRSFPRLSDGPSTLVDGLLDTGATVVVATMAGQTFGIPAPIGDRPLRNAIDYAEKDRLCAAEPWPGLTDIFEPTRTEVDSWLGATSAYVARRAGRVRAPRTGEFSALGPLAGEVAGAEHERDTFDPLRAVAAKGGVVLLAGVTLTSMTILHVAELDAGRAPFVRWMRGADGNPMRDGVGECSRGFERLAPTLAPIERRMTVGNSLWRCFPAAETLELAAQAIRDRQAITRCGPTCPECADAIAGGPIDLVG